MGLRIANNIPAMTTHRWLGIADAGLTKSLERLSSGYRINRAADDAAGLAISQSFRADIASFKVASRNTSEASALLQVAEGGMDQIGNMLTRLKELATQASSANAGSSERAKIDAEADQLIIEIDRIANATKYGSTDLLDGTFGATKSSAWGAGSAGDGMIGSTTDYYDFAFSGTGSVFTGATVAAIGSIVTDDTTWNLAVASGGASAGISIGNSITGGLTLQETFTGSLTAGGTVTFANLGITITFTGAVSGVGDIAAFTAAGAWTGAAFVALTSAATVNFKRTGLTSLGVENADTGVYTFATVANTAQISLGDGTTTETINYVAGTTHTFSTLNISFALGTDYDNDDLEGMTITVSSTGSSGNTFQIGAENNADNQIAISVDGVGATTLGINAIDLSTTSGAQDALGLIDTAISTLAGSRGDIGAYMNRLGYASANLATTIENVQAAESVIRDVDMAMEMTAFTKNQILLQAGTAMLAQANMAPQQVLALFG